MTIYYTMVFQKSILWCTVTYFHNMAIHHDYILHQWLYLKNLNLQPVSRRFQTSRVPPTIVVEATNLRRRSESAAWWIQLQRYLEMWICRHLEMDHGSCITSVINLYVTMYVCVNCITVLYLIFQCYMAIACSFCVLWVNFSWLRMEYGP